MLFRNTVEKYAYELPNVVRIHGSKIECRSAITVMIDDDQESYEWKPVEIGENRLVIRELRVDGMPACQNNTFVNAEAKIEFEKCKHLVSLA